MFKKAAAEGIDAHIQRAYEYTGVTQSQYLRYTRKHTQLKSKPMRGAVVVVVAVIVGILGTTVEGMGRIYTEYKSAQVYSESKYLQWKEWYTYTPSI